AFGLKVMTCSSEHDCPTRANPGRAGKHLSITATVLVPSVIVPCSGFLTLLRDHRRCISLTRSARIFVVSAHNKPVFDLTTKYD
ncbi:MAG: hypothetical protein QNK37_28535, partial [Acidobacteriota bacterium]|nr:hypothetical protein [Acidobacteriota bacterium]